MADTKPFKTYDEQLALLEQRGMHVGDRDSAVEFLSRVNYYRLSGYWYPMRVFEVNTNTALDQFQDGTSFELVKRLYEFDERLRNATFIELGKIETTVRTTIGHTLGRLSPSVHLEPNLLGARAHQTDRNSGLTTYAKWQLKYERALNTTKEDFVRHHKRRYDGILPVWAAVEIMDWGMLSHLYAMSPNRARNEVARLCDLSAPQLESWLKSLNVVRNYSAHHARMFNRAYDLRPRLPSHPSLMEISGTTSRAFGQLSLVQYLLKTLHLAPGNLLPDTLESFPRNELVPFSRTGAPENWREHLLWRPTSEPT
nr:Abi family protein [Corynebacterium lactis]